MKVILVNERLGHTRTYVIKGWLKGVLSLCLLGAPVALGYLGYQLSLQQTGSGEAASYDAAVHHSLRGTPKLAEGRLSQRLPGRCPGAVLRGRVIRRRRQQHAVVRRPAVVDRGAALLCGTPFPFPVPSWPVH